MRRIALSGRRSSTAVIPDCAPAGRPDAGPSRTAFDTCACGFHTGGATHPLQAARGWVSALRYAPAGMKGECRCRPASCRTRTDTRSRPNADSSPSPRRRPWGGPLGTSSTTKEASQALYPVLTSRRCQLSLFWPLSAGSAPAILRSSHCNSIEHIRTVRGHSERGTIEPLSKRRQRLPGALA